MGSIFSVAVMRVEVSTRWIAYLRIYILWAAIFSVVWEAAQMPLYTLWDTGTPGELVADVLRCTGANVIVATSSLAVALLLAGCTRSRGQTLRAKVLPACLAAVGYTAYSEWINVYVRGTWAYSDLMPVIPGLEIGLSPMAQWIVLPSVGIFLAERWSL